MTPYILSEDAERDLDGIWDHVAQDSVKASDQLIDRLLDTFDTFDMLGRTPGIGHTREDLTAYPVLFWPIGSYLIIYRTSSALVEIVSVTHGARDIPTFLERRFYE